MQRKKIGHILAGSLVEGLTMRLDAECSLDDIKTGKFVCIDGEAYRFFSLVTDVSLHVTHPDILVFPPTENEKILSHIIKKKDTYAHVMLRPMLMLDRYGHRMPVKTIPSHFAVVYEATKSDVAEIFGDEERDKKYFNIGAPLDMETPVCVDLDRLIERSNGIFGKSGTGKTFITRLVLAGLIKNSKASCLIFDMHSEYGYQARSENVGQSFVKGLKTLFPNNVAIFSLDPASTRRRGGSPDVEVVLSLQDIRVDDVMPLQDELNLHPTALEAAYLIASKYGRKWLEVLLSQDGTLKEFADSVGAHAESIGALYRKLKRLEKFSFLQQNPAAMTPTFDRMLDHLERGQHVILEFGNQTSMLCYLLVANIISRRIHEAYVARTEKFLATQDKKDQPRPLVMVIEEAHKFLNPVAAKQTIFGIIAREMRKYCVSLLVVDQRPSGIDEEILSQIGTKIIAQLNDEKDIQAILTGASNSAGLRSVLATLDSKKQALVMGHAVSMPVVIKTREYDEAFYMAMRPSDTAQNVKTMIDEIF
jgi:DNA helicase HerA-like ATPase